MNILTSLSAILIWGIIEMPKTIDSEPVDINELYYQVFAEYIKVSLQMYDVDTKLSKHVCSGVIINNTTILTAAHCVSTPGFPSDPNNFTVMANTINKSDGVKYQVVKIEIHKEKNGVDNADLAKLEIATIDNENYMLKPIQLRYEKTNDNELCLVSGWGYGGIDSFPSSTPSYGLKKSSQKIVGFETCKQSYEPGTVKYGMICAVDEKINLCVGDAGSPLVCDGKLSGIFSFMKTCEANGTPAVFTEVEKYIKWINGANSCQHSVISILGISVLHIVFQYYI